MNRAHVIIPHRSDHHPHRDTNLAWITRQWTHHFPDWPVSIGTQHDDGRWNKAAAVADALDRHTDIDVLVIADNDVWVHSPADAHQAVHHTARSGWAVPYSHVLRLTERASRTYMDDPATNPRALKVTRRPYPGVPGGGIFTIRRDLYIDTGGLDPRFLGHTGQDRSYGYLLTTLVGPCWRGRSDLVHLYHPDSPDKTDRRVQAANRALLSRYQRAQHNPRIMGKLRAETRQRAPWAGQE